MFKGENMKASFFKKLILVFTILGVITLSGCGGQDELYSGVADTNVNMTPRLIVSKSDTTEMLVEDIRSAVVGISAISNNAYSVGSGVAVADGGYILTNHHVISGASEVVVYFANNTADYAEIIWSDSALDLAIIKIEEKTAIEKLIDAVPEIACFLSKIFSKDEK